MRPAAGAVFAVTVPGTDHDDRPAHGIVSVTITVPNAGLAKTSM